MCEESFMDGAGLGRHESLLLRCVELKNRIVAIIVTEETKTGPQSVSIHKTWGVHAKKFMILLIDNGKPTRSFGTPNSVQIHVQLRAF
jgi:hypothetical protein